MFFKEIGSRALIAVAKFTGTFCKDILIFMPYWTASLDNVKYACPTKMETGGHFPEMAGTCQVSD